MTLGFEDLRVLKASEMVVDGNWERVVTWEPFVRKPIMW